MLKEGAEEVLAPVRADAACIKPLVDALHQELTIEEETYADLPTYLKDAQEHDPRFSAPRYIKKALWAICTSQDGSLSSFGEALLSTGERQIFIEKPVSVTDELEYQLYCSIQKDSRNLSLNQGELAALVMEVRTKISPLSAPDPDLDLAAKREAQMKAASAVANAGNLQRLKNELAAKK
jgi:hypothetical protein